MVEKKKLISQYDKFEKVNDIFVVKYKKPISKYTSGYMFELRVGDSSKEINLKYWGPENQEAVEKLYDSIKPNSVVLVDGTIKEYKGNLELNASTINVLKEGEYPSDAFLRKSDEDIEAMWKELNAFISKMENQQLKKLIDSFFSDKEFSEKFKNHPASIYMHQGYLGGLLEHTLHVVKICDLMAEIYPKLNRDLLISGAILHDIGKLKELDYTNNVFATEEGRLIGHLIQGFEMISERTKQLAIDGTIRNKILHMILAHHGKKEYGSPKEPMFPEALCLYLADEMDAKLFSMIEFKDKAITEDEFVYSKEFGNIYLG
ncbi:MAG: 3-5 exoribonuclease [Candidatus Woesearchaeota archaeon]|nr:3-5 exoribonuclease [Candidatus Woesearchaeota archaeon]